MVERLGVTIHEGTTVKAVRSGQVITDGGTVSAEIVVRATEGYTRDLAGHRRTIAKLVTGTVNDRTDLPWVDHLARKWEPGPFRWIGINAGLRLAANADRAEARTGRPTRRMDWLNRLLRRS